MLKINKIKKDFNLLIKLMKIMKFGEYMKYNIQKLSII